MTRAEIFLVFLALAVLLFFLRRAVERWLTRPDDVIGMDLPDLREDREMRSERARVIVDYLVRPSRTFEYGTWTDDEAREIYDRIARGGPRVVP